MYSSQKPFEKFQQPEAGLNTDLVWNKKGIELVYALIEGLFFKEKNQKL